MTSDLTFAQKAKAAWGEVPDWVLELAALADASGLKGAGERIGYTGSLVSGVLNNKYRGDLVGVEQRVRGALMGLMVECPVLGEIDRSRCLQEQQEPFRATSAYRAQLFHACRTGCPNARPTKKDS
ncbi:transcriptional regulator [Devosia sp.]|uniref:transcriptional regulator n=1 Tax=Devosia sp. TaxID=1871048 RepID=UPI001AD1ACE4|nr:transcriptional regulator [Devosia sp.]MBN9334684.1 transcriptional regulator [Devosia sp.]